jgi:hypothetical protein
LQHIPRDDRQKLFKTASGDLCGPVRDDTHRKPNMGGVGGSSAFVTFIPRKAKLFDRSFLQSAIYLDEKSLEDNSMNTVLAKDFSGVKCAANGIHFSLRTTSSYAEFHPRHGKRALRKVRQDAIGRKEDNNAIGVASYSAPMRSTNQEHQALATGSEIAIIRTPLWAPGQQVGGLVLVGDHSDGACNSQSRRDFGGSVGRVPRAQSAPDLTWPPPRKQEQKVGADLLGFMGLAAHPDVLAEAAEHRRASAKEHRTRTAPARPCKAK